MEYLLVINQNITQMYCNCYQKYPLNYNIFTNFIKVYRYFNLQFFAQLGAKILMFRIKNIRNSTVAKQNCLQPTYDHKMPISKFYIQPAPPPSTQTKIYKPIIKEPAIRINEQKGCTIRNRNQAIKNSQNSNKLHFRKQIGGAIKPSIEKKKIQPIINNQKKSEQKDEYQNKKLQQKELQKQEKDNNQSPQIILKIEDQKQNGSPIETNIIKFIRQQNKSTQSDKIKQQNHEAQKLKNQIQQKNRQQKQESQKQEQEKEKQLKQMIDKINKRRKDREIERERRKKMEQNQYNNHDLSIGAMINLTDRLAHIQMNENIMDTQIDMLLHMKFVNYPNREAIQTQIEELERINTSYLMVRSDPTNSLIRGLSNFRIQLFNRVGQLLMEGQSQLSHNVQGLQIINADSRNSPGIHGIKINRGLQIGMIKQLLIQKLITHIEECPICLNEIIIGQTAYSVKCGHLFHKNCLQSWLSTNASCPSCRYNIKFDHY